jgi:hypothetical protein
MCRLLDNPRSITICRPSPTKILEWSIRFASDQPNEIQVFDTRTNNHRVHQIGLQPNLLESDRATTRVWFRVCSSHRILNLLMNTYIRLNHSIRKLARFMQYPGRNHLKLLLHLLRHLQCHRLKGGIKFYADKTKSPLHQHLTTTGNGNFADYPIVCFSGSSFQDCPDSGRSTGGHLVFVQGAVVDVASTMPQLIAWSTCEAEYCMGALAAMAAFFNRKVYNELHGIDPDYPLTIPIGIDSKSAMDTAVSYKETQRTRHFSRRFHFIRIAIASSQIILFKVDGTANCSNCLTKPLPTDQLSNETTIFETDVDP